MMVGEFYIVLLLQSRSKVEDRDGMIIFFYQGKDETSVKRA